MHQLIYIADPMCSWCYGFRDEITQLKQAYDKQLGFSLVMGGLRPGGGDPWNDRMKDMLRHHWEQVEEKSGQPFNYDLLDKGEFNYDTEPPCRAVRVVRDLAPDKEFDFFKAIQYGFYYENGDPGLESFYQPLCEELNISFNSFLAKFRSDEYRQKTRQDFQQSASWGVRGFPTVIFHTGERIGLVSHGYTSFEIMNSRLNNFLEMVTGESLS